MPIDLTDWMKEYIAQRKIAEIEKEKRMIRELVDELARRGVIPSEAPERTEADVIEGLQNARSTKGKRAKGYIVSYKDNVLLGLNVNLFAGLPLYVHANRSNTDTPTWI